MSTLDGILYGLNVAFTFQNLLAALLGALAGTAIGVLPGLGPVAGIAMILPISYSLDPTPGLIMMAGMYYGAMYGGSTTAILVNIPGEAASVMTAIDGHKLAKRGRAGAALTICAVGSFIGGTCAIIGVMLFAPPLAEFGILFGPAEFFALIFGGLLVFCRISGGSLAASLFPMALGLMLGTIGQEAVSAQNRFTFGLNDLSQGVSLVALVVGVYGISEVMSVVEKLTTQVRPLKVTLRSMFPTREEWRRIWAPVGRGTIVGFVLGLLPGPHGVLSSFTAYRLEKSVSKYRSEIGEGAVEGVAGPETANNAAATSSMVPLLALGIPFGSVTALMLAAMMVHGVQPGPMLMTTYPGIFWGLIMSMYVGNLMLMVLNIPLISVWVSLLRVPPYIFLPLILAMSIIGAYSVNNSMIDLYFLVALGLVGYAMKKLHFQMAPMIIGIVLGPLLEKHLREGMIMGLGEVKTMFTGPITLVVWVLVLLVMTAGLQRAIYRKFFPLKEGAVVTRLPENDES